MGVHIIPDKDKSGRQVIRTAATEKGWSYSIPEIEITTSKLNGALQFDHEGNSTGHIICKIYDVNDAEITQQANEGNAVKTEIIWSPPTDHEILGGKLHMPSAPSVDVRMTVTGGMVDDIGSDPVAAGFAKAFIPSMNLKYIKPELQMDTDGRASKFMALTTEGAPHPTNKFKITLRYPQGTVHEFGILFERFIQ